MGGLTTGHDSGQAAAACIRRAAGMANRLRPDSPLHAVSGLADWLEQDAHTAQRIWVVRSGQPSRGSAWPMWFGGQGGRAEKPLLYMLSASKVTQLSAISAESAGRGILCNDIETRDSRWPKGAEPSLPVWLAAQRGCLPYDPASAQEARTIVLAALQALYVDGAPGFYYLALHDQSLAEAEIPLQPDDVIQGMHLVAPCAQPALRLLGAGKTLQEVRAAARLLRDDGGIDADVWSCPSYTRLARDGADAEHWNLLHPGRPPRLAHLRRCLGASRAPVIAVTGYAQYIAQQIGPYVDGSFTGIGAESPQDRHWIAVGALKALLDQQKLPVALLDDALKKYGLAG